jgi:predicted nucleotidyltransferase
MDFADLTSTMPAIWRDRPDGIVLAGVIGSRAHGLARQGSDTDRRGVFLAPSVEFFGLDDVQETADNPYADEVLHELGRFVRQALKANPSVIELLWLEDYDVCDQVGLELIGLRRDLLGAARVRSSYLHAAAGLLKVIHRGGDRTAKTARHMARLLITGYGLWYSGALQISLADPDFVHDFALPEQPDRDRVDDWLKQTRRRALCGVNPG